MQTPALNAVNLSLATVSLASTTPALTAVNLSWVPEEDQITGFQSTVFGSPSIVQANITEMVVTPSGFKATAFELPEVVQESIVLAQEVRPSGFKSTTFGALSIPTLQLSSMTPAGFRGTMFGDLSAEFDVLPDGSQFTALGSPSITLNVDMQPVAPSTFIGSPEVQMSVTTASTTWFGTLGQPTINEGPI